MRAPFRALCDFINRENYVFGSPEFIFAVEAAGWSIKEYVREWQKREDFSFDMAHYKAQKHGVKPGEERFRIRAR